MVHNDQLPPLHGLTRTQTERQCRRVGADLMLFLLFCRTEVVVLWRGSGRIDLAVTLHVAAGETDDSAELGPCTHNVVLVEILII